MELRSLHKEAEHAVYANLVVAYYMAARGTGQDEMERAVAFAKATIGYYRGCKE